MRPTPASFAQVRLELQTIINRPHLRKTVCKAQGGHKNKKMKVVTVEQKKPIVDEWYLVRCPSFCESGWEIAKWTGEEWEHGHFSQSCHKYVVGYVAKPLSEW